MGDFKAVRASAVMGAAWGLSLVSLFTTQLIPQVELRGADSFANLIGIGQISAYLLIAWLFRFEGRLPGGRRRLKQALVASGSAFAVIALALLQSLQSIGRDPLLEGASGLFLGIGFGSLIISSIECASQEQSMRAWHLLVGWAVTALLFSVLTLLDGLLLRLAIGLISLIIGALLIDATQRKQADATATRRLANPGSSSLTARDALLVSIGIASIGFLYGVGGLTFLRGATPPRIIELTGLLQSAAILASALIVSLLARRITLDAGPVTALRVCATIAVTTLLPLPFLGAEYIAPFNFASTAVYRASTMVVIAHLILGSGKGAVFSSGALIMSAGSAGTLMGIAIGQVLYSSTPDFKEGIFALSVSSMYLLFMFSAALGLKAEGPKGPAAHKARDSGSDALGERLKRSFGLTDREVEIALLMLKGRSARVISEELFLSINTVKSYTKSIYQKLGIHSKQELIDLCDTD